MEEFGFYAKDEDGVGLVVKSNNGNDKGIGLEHAKKKNKRPILIEIEGANYTSYKFINFALTTEEAKNLSRELARMVEYLEN